jgi:hypothetical protein
MAPVPQHRFSVLLLVIAFPSGWKAPPETG